MNAVVEFRPQQQMPAPTFSMSDMERVALAIAKGGSGGTSTITGCCIIRGGGADARYGGAGAA